VVVIRIINIRLERRVERLHDLCMRVQAHWRGHNARRRMWLKLQRGFVHAAITIQRVLRGCRARQQIRKLRSHHSFKKREVRLSVTIYE